MKKETTPQTLCELEKQGNKFALVKINETQYWRDDIAKKAGEIYGYYLVNLTEPTNCCEITVSFPAPEVYNRVKETEPFTEDELFEIELMNVGEGVTYYQESGQFNTVHLWTGNETEEEILEYLQGNPIE